MNKFLRFIRLMLFLALLSSVLFTVIYKYLPVPFTPLMLIKAKTYILEKERPVIKYQWVCLSNISKQMPLAVLTSEDQNFLKHHGLDFTAIAKAKKHNAKSKRIRGASTIPQQTAKNVFLWPARSYVRKGFEIYFTALIEYTWGKRRIMEVYLNVIETGKGIYGVKAASEHYFQKAPSELTKREASKLAVCLPNPLKWNPLNLPSGRQNRAARVGKQMSYFEPLDFLKMHSGPEVKVINRN